MTDHDEPSEPIDLTPLKGMQLDAARSEALLARVRTAAVPALERRARVARGQGRRVTAAREVERVLARFTWAAMAAAAAAVLMVARPTSSTETVTTVATASVAQAVTQTDSTTTWIERQSVPTNAELVMALGLENVQ